MQLDDRHLYDDNYFHDRAYGLDKQREAMYRQEQARIIQRMSFGNILDVGCGMGYFLESLDDRFRKYGIEPSEYASRQARQKGIKILTKLDGCLNNTMDVVVFRGTLQHISTPIEYLYNAVRVLKPGGLLAILATPDADSVVYRTFGTLPALDPPRNWIVFGHVELENILKRLGMEDIEILHPYLKTPYAALGWDVLDFVLSLFFGYRKFAFPGNMMEVYCRKKK